VILYHFTDLARLEQSGTILAEGLKPNTILNSGGKSAPLPPFGVVWLTELPDASDWDLGGRTCRIALKIKSSDPKLVKWERWAREHRPEFLDALAGCSCGIKHRPEKHWVYFGTVPLKCFREIEYAGPALRAEIEKAAATTFIEVAEAIGGAVSA